MTEHFRHVTVLGFSIVAEPSSHHVGFKIYDIVGHDESRIYWQKVGSGYTDPTEIFSEAQVYLHGSVKWDGCSNWHFDEQDSGMLHGCSKKDVQRFGDVMAMCWDWTIDLMPGVTICEKQ